MRSARAERRTSAIMGWLRSSHGRRGGEGNRELPGRTGLRETRVDALEVGSPKSGGVGHDGHQAASCSHLSKGREATQVSAL